MDLQLNNNFRRMDSDLNNNNNITTSSDIDNKPILNDDSNSTVQHIGQTVPGKTLVHGRSVGLARKVAKYKKAYLLVRERFYQAELEANELSLLNGKAENALKLIEDENDVLLDALMKYEPSLIELPQENSNYYINDLQQQFQLAKRNIEDVMIDNDNQDIQLNKRQKI